MIKALTLLLSLFYMIDTNAQEQTVKGEVKTQSGNAISHANVTLRSIQTNLVIGFTTTNERGLFTIKIKPGHIATELQLMISRLSYKSSIVDLVNNVWQYEIVLEESSTVLETVEIKSRPKVAIRGDTINYNVDKFARDEDRSIGDVLSRIPGIDVGESGEIRFNSRPISHLYLDGDDLLGGKYALGTKTIPHGMVDKVQVLTNHEHVKVKKDKFQSDGVALNLKIKDDALLRLVGTAKVGGGVPSKYDSEVNSILLNKQFKMLNLVKGNNVGEDVSMDALDLLSNGQTSNRLVSNSTVSSPFIAKKRHFINNSGIATANNSHRFKNGLFVRSNINYHIQDNELLFNSINKIYIREDTISFFESQRGKNRNQSSSVNLVMEMNSLKYYLQNDLKLEYDWGGAQANMVNNNTIFDQSLNNKRRRISNKMLYTPLLRNKDLLNISWELNINDDPQHLRFTPGTFADILNSGNSYSQMHQYFNLSVLNNRIQTNYRISKGLIEQNYGVSFYNRHQSLRSAINLIDHSQSSISYLNGENNNNLFWDEYNTHIYAGYRYQKEKFRVDWSLPLVYSHVTYQDSGFKQKKSSNYWLIEPTFDIYYQVNPQDRVSASYRLANTINDITSLYQGYIFTNYRTFQRNELFNLWSQNSHNWKVDYNFKRPLSMFFANVGAYYTLTNRRVLNRTIFEDNMQKQIQTPFSNQVKTMGANMVFSKYIFFLATTFSIKPQWSKLQMEESLNDALYYINNTNYSISTSADFQLLKKINVVNRFDITHSTNSFRQQELDALPSFINNTYFRNNLSLTYSPLRNLHLKAEMQSVHVRQKSISDINIYFIDISGKWKINRLRSELEFYMLNIANHKNFETFSVQNNGYLHNQYALNPRTTVVKYIFNF